MLPQNKTAFEKCNILQWQADNQGELATIAVIDRGDMVFDYLKENTIIPFKMKESTTDHGTSVIAVGREIAKKARVIMLAFDKHNQKQECIDYIKEHAGGIDVINVSYSTNVVTARKYFDQLKDLDIPIICSAGNDGKNKISYPARFDYTIAVGADKYYSNIGEELDCIAPTDIYYLNSRGEPVFFTGTSCAAPFVSFALALYITWRKKNGLPRLGREEIRKFIQDNCEDMYEEGHDLRSGHGLFKLPEKIPEKEGEPEMTPQEFIALVKPGAIESYRKYNILPSITIAQAALESGWGKYHIQYNLFGIKWTEGCGYDKVPRQTKEYVNGQYVTVTAYFRGYKNFSESILDHAKVLTLPRYAKVRQAWDYKEAAQALQDGGYATDPKYAEKLINIVETYKLYEIDMEVQAMSDYEGHWAEEHIKKVMAAGIMQGYPDGSFKPDQPVTRAELATVLAKIIEK